MESVVFLALAMLSAPLFSAVILKVKAGTWLKKIFGIYFAFGNYG